MTAAQWALNIALSANPIGLIIIGIIALIAGIVLLAKKLGGFGKLASLAFKMAFAPLFLAWEAMKAVGNFIGGLFGGGKKEPAAASPAVAMADGGVVNSSTTAEIGEAGPEAVVPLGDKFDLSKVEEKLAELIAINKLNLPAINKKVGDIGVAG
jgi:SLT domain-containing protein